MAALPATTPIMLSRERRVGAGVISVMSLPKTAAKTLMREARSGALATLMAGSGDPYCSLVNVATATDGSPLLLISQLALHTKNVLADGGGLHRFINVYVNDEDVRYLGSLETPIADGDVVSILPAVAGGA